MSIESKTPFPVSPDGEIIPFPPGALYEVDVTIKEVANEKIKYLTEENKRLRLEIRALKRIMKNMGN